MKINVIKNAGMKLKDVIQGSAFIFANQDESEGVYMEVIAEPCLGAVHHSYCLIAKIGIESDRSEEYGVTKSEIPMGAVREVDPNSRVYVVEYEDQPTMRIKF